MLWGFPAVKARLREYQQFLLANPGPLTQQGLDSIRDKAFHCLGGSVYALMAPGGQRQQALKFIIAFQTISDYLDNLCDRFGVHSEHSFRQLHLAMLDSLDPGAQDFRDYYALFPQREDGGYLCRLVFDCREALSGITAFARCRGRVEELTKLYIDLQSYKHMEREPGEGALSSLYERNRHRFPGLHWWEFAAACGSTLGIFTMVASQQDPEELWSAYLPWVNGLHILLDYYIDQEEDVQHDDMNLVSYYDSQEEQIQRLHWFYCNSLRAVRALFNSRFHALIMDGLLALYLSDVKARSPQLAGTSLLLLRWAGLRARVLERLVRVLRSRGVI